MLIVHFRHPRNWLYIKRRLFYRRKSIFMAGRDEQVHDHVSSVQLHLVSAFLAMEPADNIISLARVCGGGSVSGCVQKFIWDHCISNTIGKCHGPYLKNFLKKLISELESKHGEVLDEIYELYADLMTSSEDDSSSKQNARALKCISFLFPEDCPERQGWPVSRKLEVPLRCSLDMLEGDTGCSIWPSSLYLSELILSYPELFSNKLCFEVGAGVGLVGVCLSHVKASEIILSDGDLSTLANMKHNLKLNKLCADGAAAESFECTNSIKCVHLPWECSMESQLQEYSPDIILGADVIYDPLFLPHLVRILAFLLHQSKPMIPQLSIDLGGCDDERNNTGVGGVQGTAITDDATSLVHPVAYIASVIRNIDTFNSFLALADHANLAIADMTATLRPFPLLPYMQSYDRSSIRLLKLSYK